MTLFSRLLLAYGAVRSAFGVYIKPIGIFFVFMLIRFATTITMWIDHIFFPGLRKQKVERPIVLVGNPRTGTTFMQRWLSDHDFGTGMPLYSMQFPSLTVQKILNPFLPFLEKHSPARHHSSAAHETSLLSVETDDVGVFFRHFDGFFLYGFLLAWAEEDHRPLFDPNLRDTTARDYKWLDALWRRNLYKGKKDRVVAKLFSLSPRLPTFLKHHEDARILYMVRDPADVIPSGMSLVTGVLDKMFGFWEMPQAKRDRYLGRLYDAFVELFERFQQDWVSGAIDKEKVMIVRYDQMMKNFDGLMDEMMPFLDIDASPELIAEIKETADKQRAYVSKHKYDLEKFGLSHEKIRKDCSFVYETFWPDGMLE
jgi:hypothetical protein